MGWSTLIFGAVYFPNGMFPKACKPAQGVVLAGSGLFVVHMPTGLPNSRIAIHKPKKPFDHPVLASG
jgi:hypothetical protein